MLVGIICSVISAGLIAGVFFYLKKLSGQSGGGERDKIMAKFPVVTAEIEKLIKDSSKLVSAEQLESLTKQMEEVHVELAKEKQGLKDIEDKLDLAQKAVEQKEAQQQEVKTSKEEDELKLQEIMERYSNYSNEAIALEQQLAASMKNLDALMNDVEATQDQKNVLTEFSDSLTEAGARMRDLLMEYQAVNERLEMLNQQHADLEDEYTRLVEQQLGE